MVIARLTGIVPCDASELATRLIAAPGFSVTLYASGVADARLMAMTEAGNILVSVSDDGTVLKLDADRDGDGLADAISVLLEGLARPHGLALSDDWLVVAEEGPLRSGFWTDFRRVGDHFERPSK